MIIPNARITLYEAPGVPDGNGGTTPAASIAYAVACTFDQPTRRQLVEVGSAMGDATGVLYVPMGKVVRPIPGGIYTVMLGKFGSQRTAVTHVVDRAHGGQSHYEVYITGA